jgi:hypothetical protein
MLTVSFLQTIVALLFVILAAAYYYNRHYRHGFIDKKTGAYSVLHVESSVHPL